MNDDTKSPAIADSVGPAQYEAPAIEEIMTPTELEREVHYAGEPTGPNNP